MFPSCRRARAIVAALRYAAGKPADAVRLARLAPDPTAPSALLGGLYAAASFPDPSDLRAALEFAASAPDGESVACMVGALLGAVHGIEALPVDLVSRHELAWVLDTLARDLVMACEDSPSGFARHTGVGPALVGSLPGLVMPWPGTVIQVSGGRSHVAADSGPLAEDQDCRSTEAVVLVLRVVHTDNRLSR